MKSFLATLIISMSLLPAAAAENTDTLREIAAKIRSSDGDIKILTQNNEKTGQWKETVLKRKDALELVYRHLATLEYEQALKSGDLSEENRTRVSASLKSMGAMADAVFKDAQAVSVKDKELEDSSYETLQAWGRKVLYRRFKVRTPTAVAGVRGGRKLDDALDQELNRLGKNAETAGRGIDKGDAYIQMAASVFNDAKAVTVGGSGLENSSNSYFSAWLKRATSRRYQVRTPTAVAGVRGGRTLADGEKLDPSEIYKQASPSVVVVLCRGEGGGELGTGSIINAKGHILTNAHVVIPDASGKPFETIRIYFKPENLTGDPKQDLANPVNAKVLKADRALDLAILELVEPRTSVQVMEIADSTDIQPGEPVVTIGHPEQGGLWTLTSGVVSTLVADLGGVKGKDVFQTDASINRGNSGGPLIDLQGRMIGVNTSMARRAADGLAITSVNFAVRSGVVKKWLADAAPGIVGKLSSPATDNTDVKRDLPTKTEILTPAKPYTASEIIGGMRSGISDTKKKMRESMQEMRERQKKEMSEFKKGL